MLKSIRPIRIEGNVAYVPLTRGYEAVIDVQDVPLVEGHNWCANKQRHVIYAIRTDRSGPKVRGLSIHRTILGDPIGLVVDHIDGDGLNNRRPNLRVATTAENNRNARARVDNAAGLKGACWDKTAQKWRSRITMEGQRHFLGYFATPEAAHAAYVKASVRLHGDFGRTS